MTSAAAAADRELPDMHDFSSTSEEVPRLRVRLPALK